MMTNDAWANAPSLGEMAAAASSAGGLTCPACGCPLLAYKTSTGQNRIVRYVHCINQQCSRRFLTKQNVQEIVREVEPKKKSAKVSRSGHKID